MEKNSRIPLPGGYGFYLITEAPEFKDYAPPFRGSYVLVDPSGKHIRQMADYQALPFAAAMQPQPTQSAVECAGFIFTMLNGQEPYSEKELCKDIQAYADEYAEAQVAKAVLDEQIARPFTTRSAEVQQLMEALKYAGFSSTDKDGNWKMVWFKPLVDYIAQLEASQHNAPASTDAVELATRIAKDNGLWEVYEAFHDKWRLKTDAVTTLIQAAFDAREAKLRDKGSAIKDAAMNFQMENTVTSYRNLKRAVDEWDAVLAQK